jgi:hypothetical protein
MRTIEEIKTDLKRKWGTRIPSELHSELIAAQDAEIARLQAQLEWQPIETAPKDGTVIELNGPSFEYLVIGKWVDFGSYVFRGVRESGESKWVNMGLAFPKIKNPTLWRPIPPLPQAKEGSPMDNPLTDEGSYE